MIDIKFEVLRAKLCGFQLAGLKLQKRISKAVGKNVKIYVIKSV